MMHSNQAKRDEWPNLSEESRRFLIEHGYRDQESRWKKFVRLLFGPV